MKTTILTLALFAGVAWSSSISRTKRDSSKSCSGGLDNYYEYDRICEDCYKVLDNDPIIQPLCKLNCYSTTFFKDCMVDLLVDNSTQVRLENELKLHHGSTQYTQKHLADFNSESNQIPVVDQK